MDVLCVACSHQALPWLRHPLHCHIWSRIAGQGKARGLGCSCHLLQSPPSSPPAAPAATRHASSNARPMRGVRCAGSSFQTGGAPAAAQVRLVGTWHRASSKWGRKQIAGHGPQRGQLESWAAAAAAAARSGAVHCDPA